MRSAPTRRAGVYVAVLGVSMLVSVIGLAAMAAMRVQRRSASNLGDIAQARLNAISAVELGANWINDNQTSWRVTYTAAAATNTGIAGTIAMPTGTSKIVASDPIDGDLTNRPTDPVLVCGIGTAGNARQKFQVQLNPVGTPLNQLRYGIASSGGGSIALGNTLSLTGAPTQIGTSLTVNGTLSGSLETLLKLGTGNVTGTTSLPQNALSAPPSDPIPMYAALGTIISPGAGQIQRCALGPGVNPYGAGDPDGLYVYNAGSAAVTIQEMRLLGTLVIRGSGTVTISSSVFMSPARSDYPVLIVEGSLSLTFDGSAGKMLQESNNSNPNFNPPGMPYNGVTNSNTTDSYPSKICGLIHVRGKLLISGPSRVDGAIMVDSTDATASVKITDNPQINYDPTLFTNPPMGYTKTVQMVPAAGTWAQIVDP